MEVSSVPRTTGAGTGRGRGGGGGIHHDGSGRGRPISRNKQWVAGGSNNHTNHTNHTGDGERWERGGHGGRGGGRGRGGGHFPSRKFVRQMDTPSQANGVEEHAEEELISVPPEDPPLETQEEREKFYQELVKAREIERKKAIAEGKMDDPLVAKRLEDAITMVGTCTDMCPRFERYRRERENNLFEWETIPGTKRVDHKKAVKMYERAAGDKTLPGDLRPPRILKKTLDYLFHTLLTKEGFAPTFNFVRDRTRSVRNDFTMQHEQGPLAIECHDRCARFHVLALHFMRTNKEFSVNMEEQQLMNTLQSLKEFYTDQRSTYNSPTELEMRVYHRLIHIRDQKERHDDVPPYIQSHPVFKLVTDFRLHVQRKSSPITKTSKLVVDEAAMGIFGQLAVVLQEQGQGGRGMIYLVACILEHLFGTETIEDIEGIKGDMSVGDVIDGVHDEVREGEEEQAYGNEGGQQEEEDELVLTDPEDESYQDQSSISAPQPQTQWPSSSTSSAFGTGAGFGSTSAAPSTSAFGNLTTTASPFAAPSAFTSISQPSSAFGAKAPSTSTSAFGNLTAAATNPFGASNNVFGTPAFGAPASTSAFGAPSAFGVGATSNTYSSSGFGLPASASAPASISASSSPFGAPTTINGSGSTSALAGSAFTSSSNATQKNKIFSSPLPSSLNPTPQPSMDTTGNSSLNPQAASFTPSSSTPFGTASSSTTSTPFFTPPASSTPVPVPGTGIFDSIPKSAPQKRSLADAPPLFSTAADPTPGPLPASTSAPGPFAPSGPAASQSPFALPPSSFTPFAAPSSSPTPFVASAPTRNTSTSPTVLKINTDTSSISQGPRTPIAPPPLSRPQPISLPSVPPTPTLHLPPSASPLTSASSASSSTTSPAAPPTPTKTATKNRLGLLKNSLVTSGLPSGGGGEGAGILSPLQLSSPTLSRSSSLRNFVGVSTPRVGSFSSSARPAFAPEEPSANLSPSLSSSGGLNGKGKGKAVDHSLSQSQLDDLAQKADSFTLQAQDRNMRSAFTLWRDETRKRVAYKKAVESADSYRERTKSKEKRRRVSSAEDLDASGDRSLSLSTSSLGASGSRSPVKKRPRRRVESGAGEFRVPRTDEELARRLKENQEEHRQRWAPGSFLRVLRKHVLSQGGKLASSSSSSTSIAHSSLSALPFPLTSSSSHNSSSVNKTLGSLYHIWLSLNPEIDATAIWMQTKFDIPESGEWISESVFEVPLIPPLHGSSAGRREGHPATIIFECTPLNDVQDDLEKKYRILDDCARLRDIIKALPAERYFVPALLLVRWEEKDGDIAKTDVQEKQRGKEKESSKLPPDLLEMVQRAVEQEVITSHHVLSFTATTKDLDLKFEDALSSLVLDVDGRLVKSFNVAAAFKIFHPTLESFVSEWLENCASTSFGDFDWSLYGKLAHAVARLLNVVTELVSQLIGQPLRMRLPEYPAQQVNDAASLYETSTQWLDQTKLQHPVDSVVADLQVHERMGKIFPAATFLEHLWDLAHYDAELTLGGPSSDVMYFVLVSRVDEALESFEETLKPYQISLSHSLNMSLRRSPKRRSLSSNADNESMSKRLKLSQTASDYGETHSQSFISRSPTPVSSTTTPLTGTTPLPHTNGVNGVNGRSSVSPTPSESNASVSVSESTRDSMVTVAMLRALTKNMKQKYGASGKN